MNALLIQIFAYFVVFVLSVLFFNFLSGGFLLKFIRAKASMGKLILVEIDGVNNVYYSLGKLSSNELRFKSVGGKRKTLLIDRGDIYRKLNVSCITVDEVTSAVRKVDYSVAEHFDAEAYDDLLCKAIAKPKLNNSKEVIILVAVALVILVCLYNAYSIHGLRELITVSSNAVGVVN
jgi:hypothetical protein